jgi:hypothetical protein
MSLSTLPAHTCRQPPEWALNGAKFRQRRNDCVFIELDGRQRRRRLGKATIPLQKAAALV